MNLSDPSPTAALKDRYRIEREIGAGGMANVYVAIDLRHDRRVALKVLRPELAAALGAERFLAEIRTTASLQHPHILGLIDSGDADGTLYYVMPLVNGESLRARLEREKQLPVDDAVRIAREVALALDYAHREGVIHRDIKPENILLQDGQAMVADFGIALAVSQAGDQRLTHTGLSIGTPQYMSPEQALGERQLTPRTDIYSLGCVLYEMLVGEPPFTGPTPQAIVARSMISEPHPIATTRPSVPAHVAAATHVALKRIAADRFPSAQSFADALAGLSKAHTSVSTARPRVNTGWQPAVGVVLTAAIAAAAGWFGNGLISHDTTSSPPSQLSFVLPAGIDAGSLGDLAVSPDGKVIVFAAGEQGAPNTPRRLYARPLDSLNARLLPGTEGAASPFFSPEGGSIGFFAAGSLKALSLQDGSVSTIVDLQRQPSGNATWGVDGYILFGGANDRPQVGIRRVSAKSGEIEVLTRPDNAKGEIRHLFPQRLPGTETLIYTIVTLREGGETSRVVVQQLTGGPARTVLERASKAVYVGGDRLLYQTGRDIFVAGFDARTGVTSASRTRVTDAAAASGALSWDIGGDVLAYRPASAGQRSLTWVSRAGAREPLSARPNDYHYPVLSPAGDRIAFTIGDGTGFEEAWIYDPQRDVQTKVSSDVNASFPIWTPDGAGLTVHVVNGTAKDLYVLSVDGSGRKKLLYQNGDQLYGASWARNGKTLIFMRLGGARTDAGLWALDVNADTTFRHFIPLGLGGRLSPDDRWIAFFDRVSNRSELFVTPFPGGGPRWQVSRDGAREAVWSRDGTELFFRNGDQMLVAAVRPGKTFAWDAPRVLFEGNFTRGGGGPGNVAYDVSRDGQRFLMLEEPSQGSLRLNVIQGWERMASRSQGVSPRR